MENRATIHIEALEHRHDCTQTNVDIISRVAALLDEYCKLLKENASRFVGDIECQRGLEKAVCRLTGISNDSSFTSSLQCLDTAH